MMLIIYIKNRYIVNLIHEIPLPPPGKLEVSISIGELKLYCSRPPVNAIPLLQNVITQNHSQFLNIFIVFIISIFSCPFTSKYFNCI